MHLIESNTLTENISPFIPIDIHWTYCSSIFSPHSKQGSQNDSLLFRTPNWLNSYHLTPRYWSSVSNASLSNYFCMHKLACNLPPSWHCTCNNIYCLIQKWSTYSTLQGRGSCSQISYKYKLIWHIFPLKLSLLDNKSIQPFPTLSR